MKQTLFIIGLIILIVISYNNFYTKTSIDLKCEDNKVQIFSYKANVSDRSLNIKKPEYLISSQIFKDDNGNFMKCYN